MAKLYVSNKDESVRMFQSDFLEYEFNMDMLPFWFIRHQKMNEWDIIEMKKLIMCEYESSEKREIKDKDSITYKTLEKYMYNIRKSPLVSSHDQYTQISIIKPPDK